MQKWLENRNEKTDTDIVKSNLQKICWWRFIFKRFGESTFYIVLDRNTDYYTTYGEQYPQLNLWIIWIWTMLSTYMWIFFFKASMQVSFSPWLVESTDWNSRDTGTHDVLWMVDSLSWKQIFNSMEGGVLMQLS